MKNEVRPIDANALAKRIREYMDSFPCAGTRLATCRVVLSMLGDEGQTPTLKDHFPEVRKMMPIALDQLKAMNEKVVFVQIVKKDFSSVCDLKSQHGIVKPSEGRIKLFNGRSVFFSSYGAWLAYAYPPAHIDREAWVSVEERLPEDEKDGETVLVIVFGKPHENITLHGAIMTAGYFRDEGWVLNEYPEWEGPEVTHWMPLPSPPAELEKRLRGGEGVSMSFDLCSFCRHNPPSACDGKPCTMCPASGRLITTNADWIRAMSDQELSAFLSGAARRRNKSGA